MQRVERKRLPDGSGWTVLQKRGESRLRLAGGPAWLARAAIQLYRYTLSSLVGRTCRHLPTCSEYTDAAIGRHGLWAGGWMGLARIARCRPGGTSGFDPVPERLPPESRWYRPWRYGRWRAGSPG